MGWLIPPFTSGHSLKHPFPFSAIVGQDDMKQAMILTAIDPSIGGVLVFGDRGTGKSTAVRGLAGLLPEISAVKACPVNSERPEDCPEWANVDDIEMHDIPTPVVDLPLGASEDRVTGALDIERALTRGEKAFQPGLFAQANRGYLYIDEVNLLEDHIVDLLLDVAQSGENVVEREGLSIRHAARFVLVGSGNPEEGELRPQLLDRFGLSVDVTSPKDIDERVQVIKRRDAYENDHAALRDVAELCLNLGADGLRGELTLLKAARAYAAFRDDTVLGSSHIRETAALALRHRLRRDPLDDAGSGTRVARIVQDTLGV